MHEAVFIPGIMMAVSMGAIVVLATAAGLLLKYLDNKIPHGNGH